MSLNREFTFALDDSGGIEPLLNKKGEIQQSQFPFFAIAAAGINKSLQDRFEDEWRRLQQKIQVDISSSVMPPLHARLMFGKSRPPKYRSNDNPWLHVPHENSIYWYLEALKIFGNYARIRQGATAYSTSHYREELAQSWLGAVSTEKAKEEAEFLKMYDRKSYPKLYQKYITHASASLVEPTLDIITMIQEAMRQSGSSAKLLLDPYSDSSGFKDSAVFGFMSKHLSFDNISEISIVTDSDNEPLCQVADLIAYSFFRSELYKSRKQSGIQVPDEPMINLSKKVLLGKPICAKDIAKWIAGIKNQPKIIRLHVAARYASAHFEMASYAPEFVENCLRTPDEFLSSIQEWPEGGRYLPIVKPDVLEQWLASRTP